MSAIEAALQAQLLEVEMVLQIGPEPSAAYDISLPLQMLTADMRPDSRAGTSPQQPSKTINKRPLGEPASEALPAPPTSPIRRTDPEAPTANS